MAKSKFKVGREVFLHLEGIITEITDLGDMTVECTNGDVWCVEADGCDWKVVR